jgi:hypothetical protein
MVTRPVVCLSQLRDRFAVVRRGGRASKCRLKFLGGVDAQHADERCEQVGDLVRVSDHVLAFAVSCANDAPSSETANPRKSLSWKPDAQV